MGEFERGEFMRTNVWMVAIAGALYHLAMRDEMLPRYSKSEMPSAPNR